MPGTAVWRQILEWYHEQGGHAGRPGAHATRMFREVVELCITAGADEEELRKAFEAEIFKARKRRDFEKMHTPSDVLDEVGDVELTFEVFCSLYNYNRQVASVHALNKCRHRAWEPDKDGVLWRPRRQVTEEAPARGERQDQTRRTRTKDRQSAGQ